MVHKAQGCEGRGKCVRLDINLGGAKWASGGVERREKTK